jgi:hypothetical protein
MLKTLYNNNEDLMHTHFNRFITKIATENSLQFWDVQGSHILQYFQFKVGVPSKLLMNPGEEAQNMSNEEKEGVLFNLCPCQKLYPDDLQFFPHRQIEVEEYDRILYYALNTALKDLARWPAKRFGMPIPVYLR